MDEKKRKAITDLIQTIKELDLTSIMLLANGANMLRAKEKLDLTMIGKGKEERQQKAG